MNVRLEKTLSPMIYASLMVLALGLVTSTTLLSLTHILMIIPALYFITKADYKTFSKSAWLLLALAVVIILSVVVNQDIAVKGYKPMFKSKYFLFGFISIAPLTWYFKNYFNEKKISYLLYALCIATTVATISGLIGMQTGYNPLLGKLVEQTRNSGLFGMLMNYAHNLSYFQIIIFGLLLYRDQIKKYININFLFIVFLINLFGLYMTFTRGAWLGFLAGIPFYFFKKNKKWFLGAVVLIVLTGFIAYFAAGKSMYRKDYDASRIGQWQASVAAFKERPVFGYGYLNFEEHAVEIKHRYDLLVPDFRGHAHNNFFEILASTGLLGLICFVGWLWFWFKEMLDRNDVISNMGLPFIIVFVVGGLTQSTISLGINLFFIMSAYSLTQIRVANSDI
jgi:O-antigen ligase